MTNSELALLSLINEAPRHGYEIEQLIRERGMRNWTELAFSSIYYVLDRLVQQGFATTELHPGLDGRPNRKVYTSTSTGRAALKQELLHALRTPEPGGQRFLLALSCQPLLTRAELLSALRARQAALSDILEELSSHPDQLKVSSPGHVRAMFEYSLTLLLAERSWVENYILTVEKEVING
jgi:DNA-binding PadR family transcriptional regulator